MSADDFQTKYACVMESMLKSAIAETTKLFETMVDELKAEISIIKRENEDLKAKCSQFEMARTQPTIYNKDREPPPGRSNGWEKRDTAVQCDLDSLQTMLVEQCEPLRYSSLQNQKHHSCEEMVYALQEHDYETRREENSQTAFIIVKQEQEEVESTVVCGHVLDDKADSAWVSPCGTENKGPFISSVCSSGEIPFLQGLEEIHVAPELPFSGTCNDLQAVENDSSELGHSLIISLAATEKDTEKEPEVSRKMPVASQMELLTACHQSEIVVLEREQPSVPSQPCQSESTIAAIKQTDVILDQYTDVQSIQEKLRQPFQVNGKDMNQLQNGVANLEACLQTGVQQLGRAWPPKKQTPKKYLGQLMKKPAASDISSEQEQLEVLSAVDNVTSAKSYPVQPKESSFVTTPSVHGTDNVSPPITVTSQQVTMNMGEGAVCASSAVGTLKISSAESPQLPESKECHSSAALQDAMLLVEAMYQSMVENVLSPQRATTSQETKYACSAGSLKTVDEAPPQQETSLHSVETSEIGNHLTISEQYTTTELTTEKAHAPPQRTDPTSKKITVALSNNTPALPPSTQISMQGLQKPCPHSMIKSLATSRRGKIVPRKIIIVPRSVSSLMPHKIATLSPTRQPTVMPRVVAVQTKHIFPLSTAAGLSLGTTSNSSVPHKTMYVTSQKSLPVVSQSANSTKPQLGAVLPPKITIIPRQASALASRKPQSRTIVLVPRRDSTKTTIPAMVPSPQPQLVSLAQKLCSSIGAQTSIDNVDTHLAQKKVPTSDILETPKPAAPDFETMKAHRETCNMSVGPVSTSVSSDVRPTVKEKLSAIVRLTRLPFPLSTDDSVCVSRLSKNQCFGSRTILKDGTEQGKSSPVVLCANICPSLKETSFPVSVNATKMLEGSNDAQADASLSNDNHATLEEVSHSVHMQSSCPKSTMINAPDPKDSAFLAEKTQLLALSSAAQDPEKASSNDSVDASASRETGNTEEKRLQKNSVVANLRSHIKTHLQAKRTKTCTESHTEKSKQTPCPKRLRLENDEPMDKNTTNEHVTFGTKNTRAVEDATSHPDISDVSTPIRRTPGQCKNGVKPKRTSDESPSISCRRAKAMTECIPINLSGFISGRDGVSCKSKNSKSASPTSCSSSIQSVTPRKTKGMSVCPRKTLVREDASPENRNCGGPNNTNTISDGLRSKRTLSRGGVSPKMAKPTSLSPKTCSQSKKHSRTKMYTNKSPSVIRRRCTSAKDGSNAQESKMAPNSLSPNRRSSTTRNVGTNTKRETNSPNDSGPKLGKHSNSPSLKEPKLIQDGTSPQKNLGVLKANKVVKVAKAKTLAKTRKSNPSKLQDGSKAKQVAVNNVSEGSKKCITKAVWIPPQIPVGTTHPSLDKRSMPLPIKKETTSPKIQESVVYPPSVSLHPIPVKAPPVVSPLQPLSVIGRHLLKNQCGECGRVLSSSAALESHVSLHTVHRPFSCTLCGKHFADSKALKRHGRVHRNGRIHICKQCGKGFVYRFGLTKHLQMVHSRIKPFVCQICNKGCFTKLDVESHIRIHTGEKPFHCNLCEKKFARRVDLNVHLRWHNGEKRHWCPYCGKGFLDFNNLKRHKYIHTGEKPHSCPHCDKHFTQSGHLKKHVKNVHKIQ